MADMTIRAMIEKTNNTYLPADRYFGIIYKLIA
jgi:hypothetical protein